MFRAGRNSEEAAFGSAESFLGCQTFPQDYDFMDQSVQYICGMSVPPVMMAKISEQVYRQWLKGGDAD